MQNLWKEILVKRKIPIIFVLKAEAHSKISTPWRLNNSLIRVIRSEMSSQTTEKHCGSQDKIEDSANHINERYLCLLPSHIIDLLSVDLRYRSASFVEKRWNLPVCQSFLFFETEIETIHNLMSILIEQLSFLIFGPVAERLLTFISMK